MALMFQFRRLAFTQVLLGIVAFCVAARDPVMLVLAGSLGALAWYVTEGPNGRALPRWLTNIGAVAVVVWLIFTLFWRGSAQHMDVVRAMGYFTMGLQILLLYSRKSNRDYAQILMLSVLQMMGASVLSVSMIYALFLVAYCALALVTVLLFHLKSTSDQVHAAHRLAAPKGEAPAAPELLVGRGHRWQFRLMTVAVGLACATVAAAVFVLAPRSDDRPNPAGLGSRSQAGFATRVDTRSSPGTRATREPILNLSVSRHGTNVGSDNRTWLLRGAALDHYNTGTANWTSGRTTHDYSHSLTLPREGLTLAPLPPQTPVLEAQVTLRQEGHNSLFTIHPATAVQSDSLTEVTFNPLDQAFTSRGTRGAVVYAFAWPVNPPADLQARYQRTLAEHGQSWVDPVRLADAGGEAGSPLLSYARGWEVERQRVADYVLQVLAERGLTRDPAARYTPQDTEIARALADHLRHEFHYTLEHPRVERDQDPVIAFLFGHRQGHCELFASALAAMTRSIGMQSRVVTGYLASEYNRVGGYYVVRQSHAHAWVEVHGGPDVGWRTIDATPPGDTAGQADAGWQATLWQLYDHAEFGWIRSVVAFDQRSRDAVIETVQESLKGRDDEPGPLGRAWAFIRNLPHAWRLDSLSYTLAGVIVVTLGICLAYLARLLVIRRKRLVALQLTALPRAKRRGLARRLRFYLTMLDLLERHGYVRPNWQSPASFAEELADANPMRFDPVVALTEIFYEIRFGHRHLDADRRRRIGAHLRQLEHALVHPRG